MLYDLIKNGYFENSSYKENYRRKLPQPPKWERPRTPMNAGTGSWSSCPSCLLLAEARGQRLPIQLKGSLQFVNKSAEAD